MNVPIGIVGLIFSALYLEEHKEPRSGRFDVFGFVFLVTAFEGDVPEGNEEGTLAWHDIATMMELPMWDGDRHFLPLVFDESIGQFHGVIPYDGGHSTGWQVSTTGSH